MAFCKISLERTSNNLVCALQFFLCLFCARCVLLKTGHSNRNLTKKGLKIESFFFLRPPSKVTNFYTTPVPPFWKFFIRYIEQWTKTFCKKTVDRAGHKPVDRRWFWNLPVGSGRENPDRFHLCCRHIFQANIGRRLKELRNAADQIGLFFRHKYRIFEIAHNNLQPYKISFNA